MNTQQLRQKVLDLAIHGKLVKQDKNDEPAAVLLERIKKDEKGKISKSSKDPIKEPFEIPSNWCWCRFCDIAIFINGDRSKNYPNKREYVLKGIPWINAGHIKKDNTLNKETMNYITLEKYNSLSGGKIQIGDIVYCLRGTIGKFACVETFAQGAIASSLMIIRMIDPHLRDYIKAYLKSSVAFHQLQKFDNGTAQPNLSAKDVAKYLIPLPPLSEQHRIVAEIEKWMRLINVIEENQAGLNDNIEKAKAKILDLAVHGKLVEKEGKWKYIPLKEVLLPMISKRPSNATFKYIDIDSIDNKRNIIRKPKILPTSKAPSRASRFTEKGDVLFSMVRPYLKNIAIVNESDCIASTGFFICRPSEKIDSKYCYFFMLSPYTVNGLNRFMKGDNSPSINKKDIENWIIPLPPLSEQHRIVSKIEQLFAALDEMKAMIEK